MLSSGLLAQLTIVTPIKSGAFSSVFLLSLPSASSPDLSPSSFPFFFDSGSPLPLPLSSSSSSSSSLLPSYFVAKIINSGAPPLSSRFLQFSKLKEGVILKHLQGIQGIPKLFWFGKHPQLKKYTIITESLGKDLLEISNQKGKFPLCEVLRIGMALIDILEGVHRRGIIHRDIKPDNLMIGIDGLSVFLVDFGLSQRFPKKVRKKSPFMGSLKFASIATHQGEPPSPLDDIESLIYVLLFLHLNTTPWAVKSLLPLISVEQMIGEIGVLKKEFWEKKSDDIPNVYFKLWKTLKNGGEHQEIRRVLEEGIMDECLVEDEKGSSDMEGRIKLLGMEK